MHTDFPLLYEVELIRRTRHVEVDDLGDDVWVESESVEKVPVAGWAVPQGAEQKQAGHDRRTVAVELFAPVGVFTLRDAVKLPDWDETLEVIGKPENYEHNPFGWQPGLEVVNLAGIA